MNSFGWVFLSGSVGSNHGERPGVWLKASYGDPMSWDGMHAKESKWITVIGFGHGLNFVRIAELRCADG